MMHDAPPNDLDRAARVALQQRRYPDEVLARLGALTEPELLALPWAMLLQGRRLCRLHSRFAEATTLIDRALAHFRAAGDGEVWH